MFVEILRPSGMDGVANRVPAKGSAKGLKQEQTEESFALLSALGGDCIEDMQRLTNLTGEAKEDTILVEKLGGGPKNNQLLNATYSIS